jgi:hypothetical protein
MRISALDKLRCNEKDFMLRQRTLDKRRSEDQLFADVDSQILNV